MSRKLESCFSIQQDLGTTIPVPSLATWVEIWKKTMLSQQKVSPPGPWRAWPFRNLCSLPPHSSSSDDRIVSEWGEDFFLPLSGWKEESGAIIGWKKRGNFSHGRVVMSEVGVKVTIKRVEMRSQSMMKILKMLKMMGGCSRQDYLCHDMVPAQSHCISLALCRVILFQGLLQMKSNRHPGSTGVGCFHKSFFGPLTSPKEIPIEICSVAVTFLWGRSCHATLGSCGHHSCV